MLTKTTADKMRIKYLKQKVNNKLKETFGTKRPGDKQFNFRIRTSELNILTIKS